MPACIVLERWDYSLSDWNNKLQRQPDDVELKSALYMVRHALRMLACLHGTYTVQSHFQSAVACELMQWLKVAFHRPHSVLTMLGALYQPVLISVGKLSAAVLPCCGQPINGHSGISSGSGRFMRLHLMPACTLL